MVFFLVTRAGRHVLDKYLASWGGRFFDDVRVLTYESLPWRKDFAPGSYVFADLERLSEPDRREAGRVWDRLTAGGDAYRVANHPERSLRRFDLLRSLRADGLNDFDVQRLSEWTGVARYPVFLRGENDHAGPRTRLLWDADEVEAELARLAASRFDLGDGLIVEFEDCADDAGFYRKYSSLLFDGQLIPRHVFFSRSWVQKWADLRGGTWAEEELAYLRDSPHAERLLPVFQRAGLDYGRIDYSVGKNGIQVWEINTNPILLDPFDRDDEGRIEVHEAFAAAWEPALLAASVRTAGPAPSRASVERLVARAYVAGEAFKETRPGRRLREWKHRIAAARSSEPLESSTVLPG